MFHRTCSRTSCRRCRLLTRSTKVTCTRRWSGPSCDPDARSTSVPSRHRLGAGARAATDPSACIGAAGGGRRRGGFQNPPGPGARGPDHAPAYDGRSALVHSSHHLTIRGTPSSRRPSAIASRADAVVGSSSTASSRWCRVPLPPVGDMIEKLRHILGTVPSAPAISERRRAPTIPYDDLTDRAVRRRAGASAPSES